MLIKKVSIIIPCYNEEECISKLLTVLDNTITKILSSYETEVILVDDHSQDKTPELIQKHLDTYPWLYSIRLLKNSGSHIAIYAGLTQATGDVAFIMGADLQDPPHIVPSFIEKMKQGYHIVLGERTQRKDPFLKKITSSLFNFFMSKWVLSTFPVNGGDVFMVDRIMIDAIVECKEKNVNIFILMLSLCDSVAAVSYTRKERYAGVSKWTMKKLVKLAYDSVITVGYFPLRIIFWTGITSFLVSVVGIIYLITIKLSGVVQISGWTSILIAILAFGGIHMIALSILGEYLWRNFDQTRKRPLFLIDPHYQYQE